MVVIGIIHGSSGLKFAQNAFHGGPLGELVQWADLITSIYLSGHNVTFSESKNDLLQLVEIVLITFSFDKITMCFLWQTFCALYMFVYILFLLTL